MGNTFIGYNNKVTDGGVFVTARSFTRERPLKDIRFRGKTWPYIPQSKVLEVVNITLSAIVEKSLKLLNSICATTTLIETEIQKWKENTYSHTV